ncbi:unnamed protein product [Acanthosepion pharaonis]|uniref:Uncharacterized protein n=1 Tax=Acanthosepion pharaonis TaxID=158019 RepID=A0A812DDN0_ACAPH|nr:unnamed protein product [Sepia pharaonis]
MPPMKNTHDVTGVCFPPFSYSIRAFPPPLLSHVTPPPVQSYSIRAFPPLLSHVTLQSRVTPSSPEVCLFSSNEMPFKLLLTYQLFLSSPSVIQSVLFPPLLSHTTPCSPGVQRYFSLLVIYVTPSSNEMPVNTHDVTVCLLSSLQLFNPYSILLFPSPSCNALSIHSRPMKCLNTRNVCYFPPLLLLIRAFPCLTPSVRGDSSRPMKCLNPMTSQCVCFPPFSYSIRAFPSLVISQTPLQSRV